MQKSLCKIFILTAGLWLVSTANAALINITTDITYANARVTYNAGVVTNPGTTNATYNGQIFPSLHFDGLDLHGDRSATVVFPDGSADFTSYSAVNNARITGGFYEFRTTVGMTSGDSFGATGTASARTRLRLEFKVTEGNGTIDLYAAYEGAPVFLGLYDRTLGTWVERLNPTAWGQETANGVVLFNNHRYMLYGYLNAYTPMMGDPSSNFGFRFHDSLWVGD